MELSRRILLLAKVEKICCADQFKNDITFSSSFKEVCQGILLVVHQLISMILHDLHIHGAVFNTRPTKTSQLIIHNAKKRLFL